MEERARRLGGRLEIRSTPGQARPSASRSGMAEPIRVLIVDDHAVVREGLRSFLTLQDGIEVAGEAADGEEALETAAQLRPDVILMDLVMPRLDGVAAMRALRERLPGRPRDRADELPRRRQAPARAPRGRSRLPAQERRAAGARARDPGGAGRRGAARPGRRGAARRDAGRGRRGGAARAADAARAGGAGADRARLREQADRPRARRSPRRRSRPTSATCSRSSASPTGRRRRWSRSAPGSSTPGPRTNCAWRPGPRSRQS